MAYIKVKKFKDAIESANSAIEIDPNSVKGYYRRGLARQLINDLEDAKSDFLVAHKLEPENKEIKNSLNKVIQQLNQYNQQQSQNFKKMFG